MQFLRNTILISQFNDPFVNLSLGKYIVSKFKSFRSDKKFLFLSTSHHGVFIGQNQNCWSECNMNLMRQDNIPLIRRDTGGGACYVDRGNRLFSFVNSFSRDSKAVNFSILTGAFRDLGIDADMKGRNDIVVNDKKISGSAFSLNDNIFKHHGTILHSINRDSLTKYLNPNKLKLESKSIKSVNARINNLVDIKPGLLMNDIDNSLIYSFNKHHDTDSDIIIIDEKWINDNEFQNILAGFKDKKYIYNSNPEFTNKLQKKFDIGLFEFYFKCENNIITECKIFSDCLDTILVNMMEEAFVNMSYEIDSMKIIHHKIVLKYDGIYVNKLYQIFNWLEHNL